MNTKNRPTQLDYEHVELILKEATAHGLKWEVENHAAKIISKNPDVGLVEAYQLAFQEWGK